MSTSADPQLAVPILHGVLETSLCVDDLDSAEQFYAVIMGLEKHSSQPGRHVFFRCGSGMLLLFSAAATSRPGHIVNGGVIPPHGTTGAGHTALAMFESEIDTWRAKLVASGVTIESEVQWPGGGYSLYFRDPSGNSLELATPKLWGLPEV
ncbi:MAG: catechol 2,3 dioxygenase [Planctomycetaceae bacterium]|nr:catechol 2,3 dioxygenase [Planctomycetaceae bacterium]